METQKKEILKFVESVITDQVVFERLVERISADESNVVMGWKDEKKILLKGSPEFNEEEYESFPFHPDFAWFNLLLDSEGRFALEVLKF